MFESEPAKPRAPSNSVELHVSYENTNICKLIEMLQMPRAEMETFNGYQLKYWNFIKSFDASVG